MFLDIQTLETLEADLSHKPETYKEAGRHELHKGEVIEVAATLIKQRVDAERSQTRATTFKLFIQREERKKATNVDACRF